MSENESQQNSSAAPTADPAATLTDRERFELEQEVIAVLRMCYDPEIPVNIYDLGLVYAVEVDHAGNVAVKMTLTSPACPVAGSLPPEVKARIETIPSVTNVTLDLVWEPQWHMGMMSEAAKLQLGFF